MSEDPSYVGFNRSDRDLLIELKTNVENMAKAIDNLSDTTTIKVQDHETRIRFLERWVWSAIAVLGAVEIALKLYFK